MATGPSQTKMDGTTARSAVTKATKLLRPLLSKQENRKQLIDHGLLPKEISTGNPIKELQQTMLKNPELFAKLVAVVSELPGGSDAAEKLREVSGLDVEDRSPLANLKSKLKTIKELETMTQPNEELYKGTISEAIATALKDSLNTKVIKEQLSKMHQERLFSSSVHKWALAEIEEQIKAISSHNDGANSLQQCIPLKINNDYLHDASLCSVVVNKYDTDGCIKLFQSLSKVSLRKVSISHFQERIAFPKCMIANVNDVFIIAFESHFDFKIWGKLDDDISNCTFGKGLECLIKKFPTLYFESLIKENKKVIVTGFSFGGVLAHMLAAQLWQLPQLYSDQLISNLLCITFGEPLIQSELLTNVAEVFPDFKCNVHAVFKDRDDIPFLMERLDSISCSHKGLFKVILNDLHCLQECIVLKNEKPDLSLTGALHPEHTTRLQSVHEQESQVEYRLQVLLQTFENKPHHSSQLVPEVNPPGVTTYKIVQSYASPRDSQILQYDQTRVRNKVTASSLTVQNFQNHNAGVYNKCIKKHLLEKSSDNGSHDTLTTKNDFTTSDFLSPIVEQIQVTQYGDEATIVVRGKQLWFSHSFKVDWIVKQPFQTQEGCVSFSVNVNEIRESLISRDCKEKEVCLYSYFTQPITKKVPVEVNANHLSPRGRQLARLEPAHLIELAFTMALLEKQQTRLDGSQMGEFSPLFHHIQLFLHEIATVVPYESILCAIAYGRHKTSVDLCASLIEEHDISFPGSLLKFTCILVALSKSHDIMSDPQNPIEDSAYFSWMACKLMLKKYVKVFETIEGEDFNFKDIPAMFKVFFVGCGSVAHLLSVKKQNDSSLAYLAGELHDSVAVTDKEDLTAICDLSAVDLYQSLKSPVTILNEGRKKLAQIKAVGENNLEENKKVISMLENARGEQFNCCIGVLCGFMYQHYRIPFTEENPVTVFKAFRLFIGPLWNAFKTDRRTAKKSEGENEKEDFDFGQIFDSKTLISMTKKCKKMVAKGTQIAECMYDGKLRFLVSNIDKAAVATIAPSSSDYIIYSLEQKLLELCSARGITAKTPIDAIVKSWAKCFNGSPLLDVAQSHRSLIVRWMKWSLMVTELRLTLEKYTTISVSGLVNSGKSQLMRNLFGLDVKTGTIESRRTTVPFIYTLDPDVKDVHVIDFPGVDDDDQDVIKPIEFLKFISQIVVFVIHYSKAHTAAAKEWLKRFEVTEGGSEEEMKLMRENPHSLLSGENIEPKKKISGTGEKVPVLVCLTFADRLLVRDFMNDSGLYDKGEAKKGIAKHFEDISNKVYNQGVWNPQGRRTIGYYCFRLDKRTTLSEDDMKMVGIGTPMDVGNWICRQMREELHMPDSARKLQEYFEKSCGNLKC